MQYIKDKREWAIAHHQTWKHCRKCDLYRHRRNVVMWRGFIPADVLFIGEAPGVNEDLWGFPFIGNAGVILDTIIRTADSYHQGYKLSAGRRGEGLGFTYCISNIVACIPQKDNITRAPTEAEANACRSRLESLFKAVNPCIVVLLGDTARTLLHTEIRTQIANRYSHIIEMPHPAFIARLNNSSRTVETLRCVATLVNALENHLPPF